MVPVTYSAPPAFLRSIPSRLLFLGHGQTRELIDHCAEKQYRPSLWDIEQERRRRGIRRRG